MPKALALARTTSMVWGWHVSEMKIAGMLSPSTDVAELAKRAFVHLDGVSDEWLNNLHVERVAGGQVPPDQDIRLFAELILSDQEESCCKAHKTTLAAKK